MYAKRQHGLPLLGQSILYDRPGNSSSPGAGISALFFRPRGIAMRRRITAVFLLFALCIIFVFFLSSCGAAEGPEPEAPPAAEPKLTVTFLDVGQGDAALVECDGAAMLIDGGAPGQSLSLIHICGRSYRRGR